MAGTSRGVQVCSSTNRDSDVVDNEPPNPRNSFFGVVGLFGPVIYTVIVNCHRQRDTRLTAEAQNVITAHSGTGGNGTRRRLNMLLALEAILCAEYRYAMSPTAVVISRFILLQRNSYFTVINLIGAPIFSLVSDNHRQCDSVIEAEAARVDDMVESIRCAADY